MLGRLLALILVERADHSPEHVRRFAFPQILGERENLDAVRLQLLLVDEQIAGVPGEARLAVHENRVEGSMRRARQIDHPLEFGAPVGPRAHARVDKFGGDFVSLRLGEFLALAFLIRKGQFARRLLAGRNPRVDRRLTNHLSPPESHFSPDPRSVPQMCRTRDVNAPRRAT